MERKQKGPRLSVLPEHVVTTYYRFYFDWARLERQATCSGRYRLEQRVWWFICHNERPLRRLMFDTMEALRTYVIDHKVMVLHFSAVSALGREGLTLAHKDFGDFVDDGIFLPEDALEARKNLDKDGWIGQQLTNKILTFLHCKPYSFCYKVEPRPWIAKELIFDIDLNDYGDVRAPVCACGELKQCCDACWDVFIVRAAVPALKFILEDWCGFKELMYTFSGRRGVHIQVQDERAMHLTYEERNRIFLDELLRNFGNSQELRTHLLEVIYRPVFMKHFAPKLAAAAAAAEPVTDKLILDHLHVRVDLGFWTTDFAHNVKCPWTIHQVTGNVLEEYRDDFKPSLAKRADQVLLSVTE
jgi:hypothetical protein